jgi:hypothetical protein
MAAVTGPISSLPGSQHKVPEDVMCDNHSKRVATHRVQGETDSFGCEMIDLCDKCYAKHRKAMVKYREEQAIGTCDWCKNQATDLRTARDYEEGSCGPLYSVCGACIKRRNDEATAELEANGYFDDYGDVDSDYDGDPEPSFDPIDDHEPDSFHGPIMTVNDDGLPAYTGAVAYVDGQYYYGPSARPQGA